MSDDKNPNFVEQTGKTSGPRMGQLEAVMEEKRRLLEPLAEELTDAYRATIALAAGDRLHKDDAEEHGTTSRKAVEHHLVKLDYNPRTKEYVAKFIHFDDTYLTIVFDRDAAADGLVKYTDFTAPGSLVAEEGASVARARPGAQPSGVRYEDHGDDWADEHGHGGMGWQQYSSTSLTKLLDHLNTAVFPKDYQIDVAKFAGQEAAR